MNQLPVSAARWQHRCQICFATLLCEKSQNFPTQPSVKLEKIVRRSLILKIYKFFDVVLAKFKNNQILLYKISHQFQVTTKLFTG
jgi:hypothetical protein